MHRSRLIGSSNWRIQTLLGRKKHDEIIDSDLFEYLGVSVAQLKMTLIGRLETMKSAIAAVAVLFKDLVIVRLVSSTFLGESVCRRDCIEDREASLSWQGRVTNDTPVSIVEERNVHRRSPAQYHWK